MAKNWTSAIYQHVKKEKMTLNIKEQLAVLADLAEEHAFDSEVISAVRKLAETKDSPWFTFSQNNSGGFFDGPRYVIIQAVDANHANQRAESETDIYFDGCSNGLDCSCCGDRWYRCWDNEATDQPEIYGCPVEEGIKKVYDAINADYMLLHL